MPGMCGASSASGQSASSRSGWRRRYSSLLSTGFQLIEVEQRTGEASGKSKAKNLSTANFPKKARCAKAFCYEGYYLPIGVLPLTAVNAVVLAAPEAITPDSSETKLRVPVAVIPLATR